MRQGDRILRCLDFALRVSLRPRAAFRTHRAAFEAAWAAMLPAALPVHAMLAAEPRQHDEAVLLCLVQALVERAGRFGELLERGAALRHHVGA